jgi:hypothetical protein
VATRKELNHARSCYLNPCRLRNERYKLWKGHQTLRNWNLNSQVLAHTLFSVLVDWTVRNQEYHSAPYQKACCKASKETEQFSVAFSHNFFRCNCGENWKGYEFQLQSYAEQRLLYYFARITHSTIMTAFIADMERQYTYTLSIYIIMTAFSMMIALIISLA